MISRNGNGGDLIGKSQPKYLQILGQIRLAIEEGIYPINSRLPDGATLAKEYGVSLMTMKKALDILVSEGYIIRRRGDGTLVRDWRNGRQTHPYSLQGAYENYQGQLASKVIIFEVVRPSEVVAEKLGISQDDFVYHLIRLRLLDEKPIIMEYTYMPLSEVPHLQREHVEKSIYTYIREDLGRRIHSTSVKISGKRPSELECQEMGLTEHDFLMEIEQVGCFDNCHVFEYSISHHLPEVFDFQTVVFNS